MGAIGAKMVLINKAISRMKGVKGGEILSTKKVAALAAAYSTATGQQPTSEYMALRTSCHLLMTKFTMWLGGMKGIEDMRVCFTEMDADGNGTLSLAEFRQGLSRTCGMELEETEVSDLMQLLDTNGDGELQFEEFRAIARAEMQYLTDDNPDWMSQGRG
jgi:hypothetical protein